MKRRISNNLPMIMTSFICKMGVSMVIATVTSIWQRNEVIPLLHYNDVIMGAIASQITSRTIVFSGVYLYTNQRKHQSSASLAFVWGIQRGSVNSPHKWPVTRKMFLFDDVIMICKNESFNDDCYCDIHLMTKRCDPIITLIDHSRAKRI